ncbi:MAG TPA: branched-chain amino acid ABC transporter ATP-binding protein/permease, partial [Candidatus Limnocylindria bacterium]|nr:branched-chain amino acid ABC transporter ATP-binding protein/permease [Candidatus Limnocylindria bacterium]
GFYGVGVYTTAVLTGRHDWNFLATVPLAGLLAAALGLVVGLIAFRLRALRGEVFALLTLAVPFIVAPIARLNPSIDGGQGITVPVPDIPEPLNGFQDLSYLLCLAIAGIAVVVAYVAQRSRLGWALFAIRDAEPVAEGLGVPTFRSKMVAIAITAFVAGMAGSVAAIQVGYVTVEGTFNLQVPLFVIVMSVLGGRLHWLGPAIGALVIVTLRDRLATSGFEGFSLIVLGGILVVFVLLAPEGLVPRMRRRPVPVLVAFVAVVAALWLTRLREDPVDWLAFGLLAAAVIAFLPGIRRRGAEAALEPVGPDAEAVHDATAAPPALADEGAPTTSATEEPIVVATDVTKDFGGLRALDGISLTVHPGELLGLVGPNGSGKTTLVNLLSGQFRPTSGTISVGGEDIGDLPPHRIAHVGVARTYQIPRPFASMTVRDNVAMAIMFGRSPTDLEAARAAAEEHLALVGLAELADALPGEINLHERQLLEMARALATRPRVLLLDEALAGLNPVEVDNAVGVVRRIRASGIAIVLVEHLLRVVNQLATRIVVLDQGRVLADGDPATVMADPDVVRAYLGRRPSGALPPVPATEGGADA